MARASSNGQMDVSMKVNGNRIRNMAKVDISGQMAKYIMVHLRITIATDKVSFTILMAKDSTVAGEAVKSMEMAFISTQMVPNIKSCTDMERR
jgi:hypothetical protein